MQRLAEIKGINETSSASKGQENGGAQLLDDTGLVEGLKDGSEAAFRELLDRYESRLFNTIQRIVGNFSDAQDVLQEAVLKAYRNIAGFNAQSGLYTWLYRISVNAALDWRKKMKRRHALSLHLEDERSLEIPTDGGDPAGAPLREEMGQLLKAALDELSEKYRTILILREYEGLSYDDISKVLKCSKGTVESRLFRARARLREKMEKYL